MVGRQDVRHVRTDRSGAGDDRRGRRSGLYNAGVRHYGAKCLFEVLRFETIIRGRDDAFKINNSYVSRYSRLLMANDRRFDGFFAVRELRPSKGKRA